MSDRHTNGAGNAEPVYADIDAATRRLMMALDALEAAAERRRDADRDENELAGSIQALRADRSRPPPRTAPSRRASGRARRRVGRARARSRQPKETAGNPETRARAAARPGPPDELDHSLVKTRR